jgi:hypothetical protein
MKKTERAVFLRSVVLLIMVAGIVLDIRAQMPVKQGKRVPVNFCISSSVMDLYQRINEYRRQNELPPIQISRSLCYVAALHVKDLALHHPDQGPCNFHSWSASGTWKPFCYPRDENKKNSVWDKPRELTPYPSKAYEIVYWQNTPLVTDTVMMVWQSEEYFNGFLLNSGKWSGKQWNAIGIAVGENYACAWFGDAADPEGPARICGVKAEEPAKDTVKPATAKAPPVPAKKAKPAKTKPARVDSIPSGPVVPAGQAPADTLAAKQAETAAVSDSIPKTWCIIVRTNLSAEAANKLVASLRTTDYPEAKVITRDGKIRVSVFETNVKADAMARLKEVKKTRKDAWLYKY